MHKRGTHDVGGLPAGPIPRTDHVEEAWEIRLNSMMNLLREGGELAYFEYAGVRTFKAPLVGASGRKRLRGIVQKFKEEHGLVGGVIIRTAASHRSEEDVVADLSYFHQVWTDIQKRRESSRPPAVLFREDSLVGKLLRDLLRT